MSKYCSECERLRKELQATNEQENHWYNEAVRLQHRNNKLSEENKGLEREIKRLNNLIRQRVD